MVAYSRSVRRGNLAGPDLAGTTQRLDLSATPVWRADYARSYVEAGVDVYLLPHTINNDTTHWGGARPP